MTRVVLLAAVALGASGCISFSSYQSAKMLPQGGTSVGGAVNNYDFKSDEGGVSEEDFEVWASHALAENFELGGKFAFWPGDEGVRGYNLLVMPKVGIIPGVLAFTAPTGALIVTGEDMGDVTIESETSWMTQPGVVFSHAFSPIFELDLAGKIIWGFDEDDIADSNDFLYAANIGLRVTPPGRTWAVMPEIGVLFDEDNFGNEGTTYVLQMSFAFTYDFLPAGAVATAPAPAPAAVPAGAPGSY